MKYYALLMCGVIFVVFLLQQISGFTDMFILREIDRPWTFVTSIFLHADVTHLLSNLFALGLFGIIFEKKFGEKKLLGVFFAGGIISSLIASFFYASSLGASGAIFAIMGVLAVTSPRMTVWNLGVPMPMIIAAVVWLMLDIAGIFYPSNIANMAHISGMIFGGAVGFLWRKSESRTKDKKPLREEDIDEWEKEYLQKAPSQRMN